MAELGGQQDKDQREQAERRGGGPREDESRERENEALRARLDKLSKALEAQQRNARKSLDASNLGHAGAGPSPGSVGNAMALAFRVLSEFVAAVFVGAVIGWWIDRAAGTTPVFLVVFLLMGAAAGFWNVYRIAMKPSDRGG
ncbi:MAG: AtpZ/AtpI family protein [Methylocella sp.]